MDQDRTLDPQAEADPIAVTDDDTEFGNDHPLSSPSELAGTADGAIAAEFAARDEVVGDPLADANGSAAGIAYEEDEFPLADD